MRFVSMLLAVGLAGCEEELPLGPGSVPAAPSPPTVTTPAVSELGAVLALVDESDVQLESCSDMHVVLYDTEHSRVLFVSIAGDLAALARDEGDQSVTFTLPHPDVTARAVWGDDVAEQYTCTDVFTRDPVELGRADATAGTLVVSVVSEPDAKPSEPFARLDLELTDGVFESDGGDMESLPLLSLAGLFVGWLPG